MNTNSTTRQVWSYIIKNIRPFPVSIFVLFLVAFISAAHVSLRPYLLKIILDRLTGGSQAEVFSYLAVPIMLYLGMYFLMSISHRLFDYFVEIKMITHMREKIAHEALGTLIDKNHAYYQNNFSGSLGSKINDLITSVPHIIQFSLYQFLLQALSLIIAIVILWQANMLFAVFMMTWGMLFITGALLFSKRLIQLADHWSEIGSILTGKVVDVLSNILSVRLFTAKNYEKKALSKIFQENVDAEKKLAWANCWMWLFYQCSFGILQVLNFYFLCKGRQEGWITVGDFALVLVINLSIVDSLWKIAEEFTQFSKLYGRTAQALRAVLEKPELEDKQNAEILTVPHGHITFANVQFYYKNSKPLFEQMSVTIQAGQKVGLVGYSGGGKSTFVNLILRLYDVTDGTICIDNQDIRNVTQDSLRHNIAMIPQDPSLFHRTLMENIRYGRREATDQETIEAAKKAHAHEFIAQLPHGYKSLVGERGVKLSGGQRQRIAIARAILKNAPILILDEATSQLDSVTESVIQENLWQFIENKTVIVIAHRLSTLLHMDRILVFDHGNIVEDGTHTKLLGKNSLYKTLWDTQVGGFLPDKKSK